MYLPYFEMDPDRRQAERRQDIRRQDTRRQSERRKTERRGVERRLRDALGNDLLSEEEKELFHKLFLKE